MTEPNRDRDAVVERAKKFCFASKYSLTPEHQEIHELMALFARRETADLRKEVERLTQIIDDLAVKLNVRTKQMDEDGYTIRRLTGEVERYERMMAKVDWMQVGNIQISQPCDQPPSKQCWHVERADRHDLYDSAIQAFEALEGGE